MSDKAEKVKEIVDSAVDLSEKETKVLRLLMNQSLPLSSIEIAYRLKLLPSELDETLQRLTQKGLVKNPGVDIPEAAEPLAQDKGEKFFQITGEGVVALSVSEL